MNADRIQKKIDEMKKRKESRKKDFWFPKPGPNEIRVLPNWTLDMEADFYYETQYHKNLGSGQDKSVICPIAEGLEECPICEAIKGLYKTKDKEDAAFAKSIRAQTRVYWNIVDLKDKEKGVQVWFTGSDVLEQVLEYMANPKYGDVTDPIKGRNLTLKFTEGKDTKSGYNEYMVQPDPDRTPLDDAEWLSQMIDLKSFIKMTSIEDMEAILWGKEAEKQPDKPEKKETQAGESLKKEPDKPCLGKFSTDDFECTSCWQSLLCQEKRKVGKSTTSTTAPAPITATPAPVEKEVAPLPPSAGDKASKVTEMLLKIREQQGKK